MAQVHGTQKYSWLKTLGRLLKRRRNLYAAVFISLLAVLSIWAYVQRDLAVVKMTDRARLELEVYAGSLKNELQRIGLLPQILSQDQKLASDLLSGDFSNTSSHLIELIDQTGAQDIVLYDKDGRVVAATNRLELGRQLRGEAVFIKAMRAQSTQFVDFENSEGLQQYAFARRVRSGGQTVGVVAIFVDLNAFEARWRRFESSSFVSRSDGTIVLATQPNLRGTRLVDVESDLAAHGVAPSRERGFLGRTINAVGITPSEVLVSVKVGFQGWEMHRIIPSNQLSAGIFSEWVFGILAFTGFFSLAMFFSNQRIRSRLIGISRESDELKQLNMRLQSEVEQRKQAQESLAYAEQTLEQSSKLAALGQMSAAVAHELNQPLAAMKTYMAGANMLMERHRTEEAKTAFSRLDGLIDRMTTITKQLKSYAGKGADALEPVDVKQALSSAFSLVAQDYRSHSILYNEFFDNGDVFVLADRVRLEQVFINLLRNARDAVQGVASPQVTVVIESYSTVHIKFQDNGHGIDDFENLFEPFYTTKRPGDGIGLGLAISSGIISDFNGRLIAQNLSNGGAEFDVQLPCSPKS